MIPTYILASILILNVSCVFSQIDFEYDSFEFNNNQQNGRQVPTTDATTTTTLAPRQYANCFQRCRERTTPQYNPVCASNGDSFNNMGLLQCAQECGLRISFSSPGTCGPSPGGK